jgi:hypothetical protein
MIRDLDFLPIPDPWVKKAPDPQLCIKSRVSDPHRFNADPDTDPDPAFFLIADPDPGFDDLKLKKNYSWNFNFYFLEQKLQFTYP